MFQFALHPNAPAGATPERVSVYPNKGAKVLPSLQHHESQSAGGADDGEEPAEEETGVVFLKPILMHAEYQHAGNTKQSQEKGKHRGGE